MTVSRHTYATREALKAAAGWAGVAYDADVDRLLETHAENVDRDYGRHFYPRIETRRYDWPSNRQAAPRILWFDEDFLSVTSMVASGVTISASDYLLRRPWDDPGEPYDRLELDEDSTATFGSAGQDALVVTGVTGFCDAEAPAGAVGTGGITDSATTLPVTDASKVGVGDLLKIGSERILVADRAFVATGATLSADVDDSASTTTIAVTSGTSVNAGEIVLVGSERWYVETAASGQLTVRRAQDDSGLDTHSSGAAILAARTLTVVRGMYGTTAAAHSAAAAITRHVPPQPIVAMVIAAAIAERTQESAGYGASIGPGGQTTPERIAYLDLRKRTKERYERVRRVTL